MKPTPFLTKHYLRTLDAMRRVEEAIESYSEAIHEDQEALERLRNELAEYAAAIEAVGGRLPKAVSE